MKEVPTSTILLPQAVIYLSNCLPRKDYARDKIDTLLHTHTPHTRHLMQGKEHLYPTDVYIQNNIIMCSQRASNSVFFISSSVPNTLIFFANHALLLYMFTYYLRHFALHNMCRTKIYRGNERHFCQWNLQNMNLIFFLHLSDQWF